MPRKKKKNQSNNGNQIVIERVNEQIISFDFI